MGRPTSVVFFSSRPDPSNATQCLVGTSTGWLALIDVETGKVVNRVAPPTESPSGAPPAYPEFNESDPFNNHQSTNSDRGMFTRACLHLDSSDLKIMTFRVLLAASVTYPNADWGPRGIHGITMYQTFSLAITGHEDRCIRFYDITRQGGNCSFSGTNGGESNNCCVGTIVTHLDAVTCLTVDPHDLYVLTGSKNTVILKLDIIIMEIGSVCLVVTTYSKSLILSHQSCGCA